MATLVAAASCAGQDGYAPNRAAYAGQAAVPPQVLSDYTQSTAKPIPGNIPSDRAGLPAAQRASHSVVPENALPPQTLPAESLPAATLRPKSAKGASSLALPARGAAAKGGASPAGPLLTTGLSLAAVLTLFLGLAWLMRRGMPNANALLPAEVVESLGRAPLAGRQQMQLIRCGNKLLLVCISSVGAETLTEITDPQEIDRLCGLCRQAHPQSATRAFRQVLEQLGGKQIAPGFAGDSRLEAIELAARSPIQRFGREEDDDV
jgi:flagellar biogenesis protein FliO